MGLRGGCLHLPWFDASDGGVEHTNDGLVLGLGYQGIARETTPCGI